MQFRSEQENWLKGLVASLCQIDNDRYAVHLEDAHHRFIDVLSCRFPGSQPVSFALRDLTKLEAQECVVAYFVVWRRY